MKDFVTLVVPALVGVAIIGAWLFMVIAHPEQKVPDLKVPDLMVNSVTTIMGYFFGVGVGRS